MFLVFHTRGKAEMRIAGFIADIAFPRRVTVRGSFLSTSETFALPHQCHRPASFDVPGGGAFDKSAFIVLLWNS